MTGKFKDYTNSRFAAIAILFAALFLAVLITAMFNIDIFYAFIFSAAVYVVASMLLARGSFTACEDKVFFCLGFMQYVYSYPQIVSAETKTGIHNGRLVQPYIVISIKLTDGSTVTFYDESLHGNALSTPEKCMELQENHQFAQLSRLINDRTKNSLSSESIF